jgi:transcriptional regulator with XRE-family HTH domain
MLTVAKIKTPSKGRGASAMTGRLPPGVPNPIDIHVGGRVRQRRTLLGFSQDRLGAAVGLTFQQIQKYERGANRVGASRLYEFSRVLDISVSYFFEEMNESTVSFFFDDMPDEIQSRQGAYETGLRDQGQAPLEKDSMARRETLELVRNYYCITDQRVRKSVFELAKSLSKAENA